jgi:hypothetical protein
MDGYGFIGERHCLREQDSGHKQRKHFHGLAVYQILVGEGGCDRAIGVSDRATGKTIPCPLEMIVRLRKQQPLEAEA